VAFAAQKRTLRKRDDLREPIGGGGGGDSGKREMEGISSLHESKKSIGITNARLTALVGELG